jgi:hypothetical protein
MRVVRTVQTVSVIITEDGMVSGRTVPVLMVVPGMDVNNDYGVLYA